MVVIAGAQMVWVYTLKKRRTSFIYNVCNPTQFTWWITGSPIAGKRRATVTRGCGSSAGVVMSADEG